MDDDLCIECAFGVCASVDLIRFDLMMDDGVDLTNVESRVWTIQVEVLLLQRLVGLNGCQNVLLTSHSTSTVRVHGSDQRPRQSV